MTICEIKTWGCENAICSDEFNEIEFKKNYLPIGDESTSISLYEEFCLTDIQAEEHTALLSLSPITRKKEGVFFTPAELSILSAKKFSYSNADGAVLDPACGTGNLLLAIAESFDAMPSLEATLLNWNSRLYGIDINRNFIEIARKKLVRLALDKGAVPTSQLSPKNFIDLLSNIKVGDFLVEYENYFGVIQSVIMNPPFCHMNATKDIEWTSGRFNAAALFVYHALQLLPEGGKFLGILPDVLRSGTRYSAWRSQVLNYSDSKMETFGSFQRDVQVDVFILQGIKKALRKDFISAVESRQLKSNVLLMDRFDVSVGPVVPHRDKYEGDNTPYAHAKILPPWQTVDFLSERISHTGRKCIPPFIAVRRTSSPKDKFRAVGTIVNCREPVAVENHIITLSPKDNSLHSCQKLLSFLQSQFVNDYINSKIRCRHLTVGVIKEIPIEGLVDEN